MSRAKSALTVGKGAAERTLEATQASFVPRACRAHKKLAQRCVELASER
jgi:hypothetical protein